MNQKNLFLRYFSDLNLMALTSNDTQFQAFNEFVQYYHFKMDTLEMAMKMMKPGCFMASIDLKDAYYTVPIFHAHKIPEIYI